MIADHMKQCKDVTHFRPLKHGRITDRHRTQTGLTQRFFVERHFGFTAKEDGDVRSVKIVNNWAINNPAVNNSVSRIRHLV